MKKIIINVLITLIVCLGVTAMNAQASTLSAKEKSMVAVSALAGAGDLPNLEKALETGLQNGLTVNELKELLVQVYAYAGFPRSLNGLQTFSALLDKRKAQGIDDVMGKNASPMPKDKTSLEFGTENQTNLFKREVKGGLYDFSPMIDYCLKAHLFGDLFQRDVLTWKDRELITVGILAGINNVNPQLKAHLATCYNNSGWTKDQLFDYVNVIRENLGEETAKNVQSLVEQVVQKKSRQNMNNDNKKMLFEKGEYNKAYEQYFTGKSYLNILSKEQVFVANVTFEPACRNNWHIHNADEGGGQILICTHGEGWYQEWGKEARSLKVGDVVNIPAGVKHWHGAKKDCWFSHLAVEVPAKNGSNTWLEPVTDEEYLKLHG